MKVYEYVLVNEYGDVIDGTAAWTAQDCDYLAVGKIGFSRWRELGCCICQIVPVPAADMGKPGPWLRTEQQISGPLEWAVTGERRS